MGRIDPRPFDLIVVLSPHGLRTGVYAQPFGTLAQFGYPEVGVEIQGDAAFAAALADAWDADLLDDPIDYGVFVPLILWEVEDEHSGRIPVVSACMNEAGPAAREATALANALTSVAEGRRILFVASVNGSPGLSPRAPLTEIEGARELEDLFLDALRSDGAEVETAARRLADDAGSCGLGPLIAFSRLFAGRSSKVLAHERPVGVGYTVALTDG